MQTLDEMLRLHLLTPEQAAEIAAWIARARTPQAILDMPPRLWRALALASVLMNVDADLLRAPALSHSDAPHSITGADAAGDTA